MSENAVDQPQAGEENNETPQPDATPAEGSGEAQSVEELPAWAQRELKSAREEAARYRTTNKDLVEKMSGLKTMDEVEAAVAEAKAEGERAMAEIALERDRAVVRGEFPQIPEDIFALIQGANADELREAASKAAAHFATPGSSKTALSSGGGLDPTDRGNDFDVEAAVAAIPRF